MSFVIYLPEKNKQLYPKNKKQTNKLKPGEVLY